MSEQSIDIKYQEYHDNITNKFRNSLTFKGVILSQEEFDKLHTLNWLNHEKELVDNNFVSRFMGDERSSSEIASAITTETNRTVKDIEYNNSTITYNVEDR